MSAFVGALYMVGLVIVVGRAWGDLRLERGWRLAALIGFALVWPVTLLLAVGMSWRERGRK